MLGTKIDTLENKKILERANQKAGSLKKMSKISKSPGKWSGKKEKRKHIHAIKNEDRGMTKRRACVNAQSCLTLGTVALQAPLSMGFSRREYWSGLPIPPPGDLPHPEIKPTSPTSPALAGRFFTTEPPGKPNLETVEGFWKYYITKFYDKKFENLHKINNFPEK